MNVISYSMSVILLICEKLARIFKSKKSHLNGSSYIALNKIFLITYICTTEIINEITTIKVTYFLTLKYLVVMILA